MDYGFSEDQNMIRETVRKFLENECPREKIRELMSDEKGYDPELWRKMAELGWMGLVIPEEYDGTGMGYLDLMILMEEMGRNILPAPYFSTVALCSVPILQFGTEEQKRKILPRIASGEEIWALAMTESFGTGEADEISLSAVLEGDEYILNGTKLYIPYAHVADNLLVVARTGKGDNPEDGITVFMVEAKNPALKIDIIPTAAHDMRCEILFDNVRVPEGNILGKKNDGWEVVEYILQYATVLKCAEMSGGAQAALEISNQYAKERVQFDKPIGSFQAIQHKLVNMLAEVEGLKYLVYEAAWRIDSGSPSKMLISMAKTKANKVYQRVCLDSISIHGAIGFTEEMDITLYHLRIKALEFDLGGSDFHRERIARELEDYQPEFLSLWD
jgi:alkylation response protein AidB-like acyl-CoA dehydrogenase